MYRPLYTSQLYMYVLLVEERNIVISVFVCLSVCVSVSVCAHVSETSYPNFTKFSLHVSFLL